jgi:transcriptional regulator with XRE-family HTH domain
MKPGLEDIGRALRNRRTTLGVSQDRLSESSGITQARISGIERGANARIATLVSLSRSLGMEFVLVPRDKLPETEALLDGRDPSVPLYSEEE